MADIRVDIDTILTDGMDISFKAPCNCTEIDGIKVCYVKDKELVSQRFMLKDAHGNDLAGIGNLFMAGAYIRVILNSANGFAYIQNADTNGYIEEKFAKTVSFENFCWLEGTDTKKVDSSQAQVSVPYPNGFTKDNCCVVGAMVRSLDGAAFTTTKLNGATSGLNLHGTVAFSTDAILITYTNLSSGTTYNLGYRLVLFRNKVD